MKLVGRFQVLEAVQLGLETEAQRTGKTYSAYQEWVKSEMSEALTSVKVSIETVEDGILLAILAAKFSSQEIFNN